MFAIDQEVQDAIRSVIHLGGNWHKGRRSIISDSDATFYVAYWGANGYDRYAGQQDNKVFGFNRQTRSFWLDDCGWLSRTTKNLINDCLTACGLPYQVFVSKKRFCIRNLDAQQELVIGDGRVQSADITTSPYWRKKV